MGLGQITIYPNVASYWIGLERICQNHEKRLKYMPICIAYRIDDVRLRCGRMPTVTSRDERHFRQWRGHDSHHGGVF